MEIRMITESDQRIFDAVSGLLHQLSPDLPALTREHFNKVLNDKRTFLFIGEHENNIMAMMTIVAYVVPSATRFWIEDLVVDEAYRGRGFGRELINYAIRFARSEGAKTIDLTSRPFRTEANQLYRSAGFSLRETNVYRYFIQNDKN